MAARAAAVRLNDPPDPFHTGRNPARISAISDATSPALMFPTPTISPPAYTHANDAVLPPAHVDLSRIDHLRGRRLVTVDLDGTVYARDRCGHPVGRHHPDAHGWDENCDHADHDVITEIRRVCDEQDAIPVVLSWRAGAVGASRGWLEHVGLEHAAVFIPGSGDDIAGLMMNWTDRGHADHTANRAEFGGGQVAFKVATVRVLTRHLDCDIVASFDDNPKVTSALTAEGVTRTVTIDTPPPQATAARCVTCHEPFGPNTVRAAKSRCVDCSASTSGWTSADDLWAGSVPSTAGSSR